MGWGLDAAGKLDAHTQRHFMETLDEHTYMAMTMGNLFNSSLAALVGSPQNLELRRHVFASLNQMVVYSGRVAVTIRPIFEGSGELKVFRQARSAFMAELFSDPAVQPLHDRAVRHVIEHYDERLEKALLAAGDNAMWVQDAIMSANALDTGGTTRPLLQRSYDPETGEYVVLGVAVRMFDLAEGINHVARVTRAWLAEHPSR